MLLTFCFAIPFLLVAVPGKFLSLEPKFLAVSPRPDSHTVAIHGWPAVHCIANYESPSTTQSDALNNRKVTDAILFGEEGRLFAENVNSIIWANEQKASPQFPPCDFVFNGPFCSPSYEHQNFWSDRSHYDQIKVSGA